MNDPVPGAHPDQDVLADLAAGVLPAATARAVEAHVMACAECERLLLDAEHIRTLLRTADPGPMPDEVWSRIAAGIATESAEAAQRTRAVPLRGWFDTLTAPTPESTPVPVPTPPPALSFDEAPTAAWKAFLSESPSEADRPTALSAHGRGRAAVRSSRSRRDVRTEDDGGTRWTRPKMLIGLAAAGVAVLGLGGLGTAALLGGDPSGAAVDALPGISTGSIVRSSTTNYTSAGLAAQASTLVTSSTSRAALESRSPAATAGTVADPQQLAACLGALGEGDRGVLVVDLARYNGREAAVIVLPGRMGGYVVWVVARDCRPGAEGTLGYTAIPA